MFKSAEYSDVIQALIAGFGQLKPDGNSCAICEDSGHQAWECHHNPLVIMQRSRVAERDWQRLERSYSKSLGEMARLSDIVCTWVIENRELAYMPDDVGEAASQIMEYVEAVRP